MILFPRTMLLSCAVILTVIALDFPMKFKIQDPSIPVVYPYDGIKFGLASTYTVKINHQNYTVPKDFITDLASIPRPLWIIIPPHSALSFAPSILHDYFYSGKVQVSRKFADDVFYNHLVKQGISKFKSYFFWSGVRLFGWMHFKECKS